ASRPQRAAVKGLTLTHRTVLSASGGPKYAWYEVIYLIQNEGFPQEAAGSPPLPATPWQEPKFPSPRRKSTTHRLDSHGTAQRERRTPAGRAGSGGNARLSRKTYIPTPALKPFRWRQWRFPAKGKSCPTDSCGPLRNARPQCPWRGLSRSSTAPP